MARPLLRELLYLRPRRVRLDFEALGLDDAVGGVVEELDLVLLVHVLVAVGVAARRGARHGCFFFLARFFAALRVLLRALGSSQ